MATPYLYIFTVNSAIFFLTTKLYGIEFHLEICHNYYKTISKIYRRLI